MLLALFAGATQAMAVARPGHRHEDLFGESEVQIGFKLGPELTGYTPIQVGGSVTSVQSSVRFLGGAAFKFVYSLPRFEADFLWNARAGINTDDTYHSLSAPVLMKIPIELEKMIDFEAGAGFETDQVMFGALPHRTWMFGILGSVGFAIDFTTWIFELEGRYNVGLANIADSVNGARPRDVQFLGGALWHF